MDPRYEKLRRGLDQLTDAELVRLLEWAGPMVFDEHNYDESTGRW